MNQLRLVFLGWLHRVMMDRCEADRAGDGIAAVRRTDLQP